MCSTYLLYVIFHSFLCKLYCNTSTTHNGNGEPLPRYFDTRSIGCFNAFTCLYIRICWRRQCRCYRRQRSVGYKLLAKLKRMLSMRTNCKFKWFYDRCVCVWAVRDERVMPILSQSEIHEKVKKDHKEDPKTNANIPKLRFAHAESERK